MNDNFSQLVGISPSMLQDIFSPLSKFFPHFDLTDSNPINSQYDILYYISFNYAGVPDLLYLLCQLTQSMMSDRLAYVTDLRCTVLDVRVVEGLGTTIDVILANGYLHAGDTIVVCGLQGPIVTTIRALLIPPPLTEIRIKTDYIHLQTVKAAMGVKISANGLENAIAGSQMLVCGKRDNLEDLQDEVMKDLQTILSKIDKSGIGVCVQASTLGSLEALLAFLEESKVRSIDIFTLSCMFSVCAISRMTI